MIPELCKVGYIRYSMSTMDTATSLVGVSFDITKKNFWSIFLKFGLIQIILGVLYLSSYLIIHSDFILGMISTYSILLILFLYSINTSKYFLSLYRGEQLPFKSLINIKSAVIPAIKIFGLQIVFVLIYVLFYALFLAVGSAFSFFTNIFFGSPIVNLIFGLLFFVIEIIITILSYYFFIRCVSSTYYIIDQNAGIIQSIKLAFKSTKGQMLNYFEANIGLMLISLGINMIGVLLFGFGLIFTLIFTLACYNIFSAGFYDKTKIVVQN